MTYFALAIFWCAALIPAYTYLGYPALLWILTRRRAAAPSLSFDQNAGVMPAVSVIIVAHNEAKHIQARIANLRQSAGVGADMEIIVVSDGATDATAELARDAGDRRLRLIELPQHAGKAAGLNAGMAAAHGKIIVFTDARQQFAPDTILRLAGHFADPRTGAVSGALELVKAENHADDGLNAYWNWEKKIRHWESLLDSAIGCTGAVYAARRDLLNNPALPPDTLLDDVVIPMQIAVKGHRVLFDPAARAFDPLRSDSAGERRRKARTLAGNFQMFFRHPGWLLPWRNRLWWQLLSHKYMRLLTPPAFILLPTACVFLTEHPFYTAILTGLLLFYALGLLGLARPDWRARCVRLPAAILFFGFLPVSGLWFYLTRRRKPGWETHGVRDTPHGAP